MTIKAVLYDSALGVPIHSEKYLQEVGGEAMILAVTDVPKSYGFFKTTTFTAQATTELVTPRGNQSILLTDLIVTFEKKNLGTVRINFHDGTNTETIFYATLTDAPVNVAINFTGRWQGWKTAHIDVITGGADSIGSVAIGYVRCPENASMDYTAWVAAR